MWTYEKKLQYPVRIKNPNAKLAKIIASQYGGPNGEIGASLRYLSQRYTMPYPELSAILTDIGTEAAEMFQNYPKLWLLVLENKEHQLLKITDAPIK